MPFTYDVTSPAGQVRFLAFDTDPSNYTFDDTEISAVLNLNNQDVKLGAAQLVDLAAGNQAYVYRHSKVGGVAYDAAKVAAGLQAYANELRRQAYEAESDMSGFIDWIEVVNNEFAERERMVKQYIRIFGP